MKDIEFVDRLSRAFDNASMADVARRLGLPHATVRNYFREGRLPAPEVLIMIARETGVSLNWLLLGTGEMYTGDAAPLELGRFLEQKIHQIIDQKLSATGKRPLPSDIQEFDVEGAVIHLDDPQRVMREWLAFEGREYPSDFGMVFFQGWGSFSLADKIDAVRDAKRVFDRVVLRNVGQ